MSRVLLVGGGITSAVTAYLLRNLCEDVMHIVVWDKARGVGGRMSTSRSPSNPECTVDLGAQFITATPDYQKKHRQFYDILTDKGLLVPLIGKIDGYAQADAESRNYVAPLGLNSVVKHFFTEAGVEMKFQHHVSRIDQHQTDSGPMLWKVTTQDGTNDVFDAVFVTTPTPQILQLAGTIHEIIDAQPEIKERLQNVVYSSRYALGLFYDKSLDIDTDYCAKYVKDDPCIRYISIENKKRIRDGSPTSVVVHTGVPFGVENLEFDKDRVVLPKIRQHLASVLPDLPEPNHIKCHRWRYSQVVKPYFGTPGYIALQKKPLMACGGDAFVHSNFDGCVASALRFANDCKSLNLL